MRYIFVIAIVLLSLSATSSFASVWDDVGDKMLQSERAAQNQPKKKVVDERTPDQKLFADLQKTVIKSRQSMRLMCAPLFNVMPGMSLAEGGTTTAVFGRIYNGATASVARAYGAYSVNEDLMPEYVAKAQLLAQASAEFQQEEYVKYKSIGSQAGGAAAGAIGAKGGSMGSASMGPTAAKDAWNTNPTMAIMDMLSQHSQRIAAMMPGTNISCMEGSGRVVAGGSTYDFNPEFAIRGMELAQDGYHIVMAIKNPSRQAPEQIQLSIALQSAAMAHFSASMMIDQFGARLLNIQLDVSTTKSGSEMDKSNIEYLNSTASQTQLLKRVQEVYDGEFSKEMSMLDFVKRLFTDPDAREALIHS